ncbi:hypothetical protein JYU34_007822 [Plutella xylostella]|uniref:NADH dehydrogenase [ubiquinone] 1 beta subcomplex subunit 11, mitochondrial n=2 Tax=Plutella xylostella TaxID=51655 RepID=A0A8S4EFG0_PLUXY|nr:hypothetical protein JYU34_007822 [Plutella xylostella]CAG9114351.1 unnamed protein product [Plutella xylostella]
MASLIKLRQMSLLQRCALNHVYKTHLKNARNISTSKKNSDTAAAACETSKEDKNWVSYGFHYDNKTDDTNVHNASYFFSVTLCIVFGGFFWTYAPDAHLRDWAQREAFLELRRREQAGLPPIDPNYVPPSTVCLPSDEELKDIEIII